MKTAVRLGPIAHLRRAKCIGNISNNQACEFGINPHSHTWLPYITPNGVRLAHEILTNSYSYNQTQGFIGDTNFPMTNKKLHFFFALRSVCTNSRFAQVRRRLGKKNKSFFDFCFVFLSPCTNFAVAKDEVQ